MRLPRPPTLALLAVLAALVAAGIGPPSHAGAARAEPVLALPVADGRIVDLARIPEPNWLPGHRGIDIAATPDAVVVSPGDGRVVFAGIVAGRPVISIELDVGLRASLEPVVANVDVGSRVAEGDPVGLRSDGTGHCTACVHWGLRDGERYVDPLDWLEGYGRIVLLPAGRAA